MSGERGSSNAANFIRAAQTITTNHSQEDIYIDACLRQARLREGAVLFAKLGQNDYAASLSQCAKKIDEENSSSQVSVAINCNDPELIRTILRELDQEAIRNNGDKGKDARPEKTEPEISRLVNWIYAYGLGLHYTFKN